MTNEEADQRMKAAVDALREHFDAVQIVASYQEEGITHAKHKGVGNWYARQGLAREFVYSDVNRDLVDQIAKRSKEEE
jgi:alcohol dehydrogenase YqhD (iron-dependent ADH family)